MAAIDIVDVLDKIARILENKGGGGGDSFSPDITNPQDGDTLVYNAAQQKWVNGAGSGNSVLCIDSTDTETGSVLGKTWQEIYDVFDNGSYVYVRSSSQDSFDIGTIVNVYKLVNDYIVNVLFNGNEKIRYKASSSDGYPAFIEE